MSPPAPRPVVLAALHPTGTPLHHTMASGWQDPQVSFCSAVELAAGVLAPGAPCPARDLGLPQEMAWGQPGQVARGQWLVDSRSRGRLAQLSPWYGSVT